MAVFGNGGNNQLEVSDQALLVALEWSTATAGVVTPRGEKASGDLVIGVPDNLADEGELSFRDLVLQRWDTAEAHPN